jgi:EpsI family protein
MTMAPGFWRLVTVGVCLLGTIAASARATRPEAVVLREPLEQLPKVIEGWTGHDAPPFTREVLEQLGVDEYVNRVYVEDEQPVALYVGYYASQQTGDTIHSPQNCLPGAGWLPVTTAHTTLPVPGRGSVTINRLLIQKGADRQVVLYWYQSHGRVVASDYLSKAYLVVDAIRRNRSDAAMVRIISPVLPGEADDTAAGERAQAFVRAVFPQLDRFLPI